MTITQNDVLQVAARIETQEGDDVVNVFQFKYASVPTITDTQGIDDVIEFLEALYTIYRVVIPILSVFRDLWVRNMTTLTNYGVFPWATLVNGGAAGNDLPPGVASMISFPTGKSRVTLRKYLGNNAVSQMTLEGRWIAAHLVITANVAALMVVPYVATNGTWAYGYTSPIIPGWIAPDTALILDVPSYQRRRRQGRGS